MEIFSSIFEWYFAHLDYFTVALLMAIESTFVPLPSEVVIPPAALLAVSGQMNIFLIVLYSSIGCVVGALINYTLSYYLGRKIIYSLAESKVARIFFVNKAKVEHAEEYFRENGNTSTFIGRLLPGVRHLISIPAGLAKMDLKKFIFYTFTGSLLWNAILTVLSYYLAISLKINNQTDLINKVTENSHVISYVMLGIGILFVAYLIWKNKRKKNKATK